MNSILLLLALGTLAHGSCIFPGCPSAVTGCSANRGCYVQHATTARCSSGGCSVFTQEGMCSATPGCMWFPGSPYCDDAGTCSLSTEDACTAAGCSWKTPIGSCLDRCYELGKSECEDSSNGCEWKPNFCGGPTSCSSISVATDCEKSKTGCEWSGWDCQPASGLTCVSNGTGCDVGLSEVGCWWQSGYCTDSSKCGSLSSSQAVCEADSKMCMWASNYFDGGCSSRCSSREDGSCADSSPSYCKTEVFTFTESCITLFSYCQTERDGSGCTPESNQTLCSFEPAITAESCVVGDELAEECPLQGDSCSARALSWGCVNSDSNAAFAVYTSSSLVFVAILSLLLF